MERGSIGLRVLGEGLDLRMSWQDRSQEVMERMDENGKVREVLGTLLCPEWRSNDTKSRGPSLL